MAKAPGSWSPPRKCPSCWPSTGPWTGGPGRRQVAQPLLSHPYQPPGARLPERRDRNGVRNRSGDKGETVRVLDAREGR